MQFANDVQEGTLNTKTTPCSHGFKIYCPGQTDKLTKLIYKIGNYTEDGNLGFSLGLGFHSKQRLLHQIPTEP